MKLSIIIVSYNTKDILDQCLKSIYASDIKCDYEIIIVDNASKDGSVELIKEKYKSIKLIANEDNKLFAIANNQGAKIATGKYLLLLNSDTIVYDDNLSKIIDFMDKISPNIICVGPKILNKDKTLQAQGMHGVMHKDAFCFHFKLGKILPKFIGENILPPATYNWNKDIPHEVGWVTGCCMMIRRKEYMELGGLNENLEFYGEEPEFSYRAKKRGYLTYYYPDAEIIHLGGASTKKEEDSLEQKEKSFRRYSIIVKETVGYKYAIGTSRITMLSYYCKYLFSKNKQLLKRQINTEKEIISKFKNKINK